MICLKKTILQININCSPVVHPNTSPTAPTELMRADSVCWLFCYCCGECVVGWVIRGKKCDCACVTWTSFALCTRASVGVRACNVLVPGLLPQPPSHTTTSVWFGQCHTNFQSNPPPCCGLHLFHLNTHTFPLWLTAYLSNSTLASCSCNSHIPSPSNNYRVWFVRRRRFI